jgi:dihydroorotate dehydrogenase subfamily 1
MGLYRSVGRPLFFSLPPEASHGLAGRLLRSPLPWKTIGGAVGSPTLRTDLAGLLLRNPVGMAAGFDKDCRMLTSLGKLGFGYVVGGTLTRGPREGNPKPRIVRIKETGSLVNSMGLPNPGVEAVARRLARLKEAAPVLVSLADEDATDVAFGHSLLQPLVDGFELNASCPNVSWGRDTDNEAHLKLILATIAPQREKPLFVKLPPFFTDKEREAVLALARVAVEGGADGLTCSNSREVQETRFASGKGGMSGGALTGATPRIVAEVREAVGTEVPINACGGIATAEDAMACLEAGATTVQVYSSLIYEGPRLLRSLTAGLAASLAITASDTQD